jgi:hypothetical protein
LESALVFPRGGKGFGAPAIAAILFGLRDWPAHQHNRRRLDLYCWGGKEALPYLSDRSDNRDDGLDFSYDEVLDF